MRHKALVAAILFGLAASDCADFDTTRAASNPTTVGREIVAILCDRIGAQAFREDVTGASFRGLCHGDSAGSYSATVDLAKLPPLPAETVTANGTRVTGEELRSARLRRVAKVEAMGRQRERLVAAFNALLQDTQLGSAEGCDSAGNASFLEAFRSAAARMFPLYDDGTVPRVTRAAGDLASLAKGNEDLLKALASVDGRQGYRPRSPGPSALYTLLSYPRLAPLARSFLALVDDSDGRETELKTAFHALLDATRSELATLDTAPSPRGPLSQLPAIDAVSSVRPSRPRSPLEGARALLLAQHDGYATGKTAPIVARDARGVARVALTGGRVLPPFVDANTDGAADVDAHGVFKSVGAAIASPFFAPGAPDGRRDAQGFAVYDDGQRRVFEYLETQKTLLGALVDRASPLLTRRTATGPSLLFDGLAALAVSAGPRSTAAVTRTVPLPATVQSTDTSTPPASSLSITYKPFEASLSPLVELASAVGSMAAEPAFDEGLVVFDQLLRDHPQLLAKFVDFLFKAKAIADAHPEARLAKNESFWDDLFPILERLAKDPKVLDDLMRAISDPRTNGIDTILVQFLNYRDHISYDANNLNGRNFNFEVNRALTGTELPYKVLVDRQRPDSGANRSGFQRFVQLLHDANGLAACTKEGAVAHIVWRGLSVDYPGAASLICPFVFRPMPPSRLPQCGVLRIDDVAALLLDVALGRAKFDIRDSCLAAVSTSPLTGIVGGANAFLEEISGVKGFSLQPTVGGIARLAYFKTPWTGLPDETNPRASKTRAFIRDILDPIPTMVCDAAPFRDTDGRTVNLRRCQNTEDLMRVRDIDALFALDDMDFVPKVRGLAAAFADNGQDRLFVDLFDTLHRHWGTETQTRGECDPSLPKTNPRWCSQDGAVRYESVLAEMLDPRLGFLPLAQEFITQLKAMRIPHCTGVEAGTGKCLTTSTRDGVSAFADLIKLALDSSRSPTLVNARGERIAKRNDGAALSPYSPALLAVEALGKVDRLYEADASGAQKKLAWQKTRSLLVDRFFATQGTGSTTRFESAFLVPAARNVIAELRGELDARCPHRRAGQSCAWAQTDWARSIKGSLESPLAAAAVDLFSAVNAEEKPRNEVDAFLTYLAGDGAESGRLALVGALGDALQWLDTGDAATPLKLLGTQLLAPPVVATGGGASARMEGHGLARGLVTLMATLFKLPDGATCAGKAIDPHDAFATIAARLDAPMGERGETPLEAISSALFAVNRADPSQSGSLSPEDFGGAFGETEAFFLNRERGLEQIYAIVHQILAVQPK